LNGAQPGKFLIGARCGYIECADALGNFIDGRSHLCILLFKHQVQITELGTFNIPVKVMSLKVKCVGIGQQMFETFSNFDTIFLLDADVDCTHGNGLLSSWFVMQYVKHMNHSTSLLASAPSSHALSQRGVLPLFSMPQPKRHSQETCLNQTNIPN